MTQPALIDRDLSILDFNARVLDWAARTEVPLLERLRYLSIVSSNLDEYFEVRMANLLHAAQDHINDFERMLTETGTVILKFMLHISKEEQRLRLQERIDDPKKHWKFTESDLTSRKQWRQYQNAYAALLGATSTPWAPWTIVPANNKTQRNLFIGTQVRDTLKAMNLRYPPASKALKGLKIV